MALIPGLRLGSYEVLTAIGAGGMGEVYRARDSKLNRDVALKILPDAFTHDPDRLARFKREAQVLASLNHPNIGAIYGFEESNGTQALVLELVDGPTLADRIAQGPIPIDDALPIAKQIAEALEAAHEQGIIHRDLKPANIKVRPDGTVKVLDFGLAKALTDDASSSSALLTNSPTVATPINMTGIGVLLGTAPYISPEQAKGRAADKRSDIWAFGCVLYEMLTGKRAFAGDDISDTLASVLRAHPDWSLLPPQTPQSIVRLLRRSLEKDRKRRTPDIAVAHQEIEEAANSDSTQPIAHAKHIPTRSVLVAISVGVLLGVALTAVIATRRRPEPGAARSVRFDVIPPGEVNDLLAEDRYFAVSPDGRYLVFTATVENTRSLWIRQLDETMPRRLPGTENGNWPFWSADSGSVAFFSGGKLRRVDLSGGSPRALCDAAVGGGGTWNRDGIIVFGITGAALFRVPASGGGQCEAATRVMEGQTRQAWPQFLPDGQRFIFTAEGDNDEARGLFLASLTNAEPRRLREAVDSPTLLAASRVLFIEQNVLWSQPFNTEAGAIVGTPERVANVRQFTSTGPLGFSTSENGVLAFLADVTNRRTDTRWVDRRGTVLGPLVGFSGATLVGLQLSPDDLLAMGSQFGNDGSRIWLIDLKQRAERPLTYNMNASNPVFSRTQQIAFNAVQSGRFGAGLYTLYVQSVRDSAEPRRLLESVRPVVALDWLPDGRTLLYQTLDPKTGIDLWSITVDEGSQPKPILGTSANEAAAQLSPDGRSLAYQSDESGRPQVYLRPFPIQGLPRQLSINGGTRPRWRPDGKELFYLAPDGTVMAVPISDGPMAQPGAAVALFSTKLNYATNVGLPIPIYAVSARGDRFLMSVVTPDSTPAPITVLVQSESSQN